MKKIPKTKIKLNEDQLRKLLSGDKSVKGYEDFYAIADPEDGRFDGEKGAMYEYPIQVVNDKTGDTYKAIGGYYTGPTGHCFYEPLVLELVKKTKKPKAKKKLGVSEIKKSLKALINKSDVKTVKKILSTLK